jgi:hypothetical protein
MKIIELKLFSKLNFSRAEIKVLQTFSHDFQFFLISKKSLRAIKPPSRYASALKIKPVDLKLFKLVNLQLSSVSNVF